MVQSSRAVALEAEQERVRVGGVSGDAGSLGSSAARVPAFLPAFPVHGYTGTLIHRYLYFYVRKREVNMLGKRLSK